MELEHAAESIGISVEVYKRLCRTFIDESEKDLLKLESCINRGRTVEVEETAHHIKGAAINLDFSRLSAAALEIESGSGNLSQVELRNLFKNLEMEFNKIKTWYSGTV